VAQERSTKPYLIRAIYEWCSDSGFTPYISVKVNAATRVPPEYVKDGEIVLNIGQDAAHRLTLGNDVVQFAARFNGHAREISIPVTAIQSIFARENGQGLFFPPEPAAQGDAAPSNGSQSQHRQGEPQPPGNGGKPRLQVIK
jgi:stringent starvation protein B